MPAGRGERGRGGCPPRVVIIIDRQRVIGLPEPLETSRGRPGVVSGYIRWYRRVLGMDVSAGNGDRRTASLTDSLRLPLPRSPGPLTCQHPGLRGRQPFAERRTVGHLGGRRCRGGGHRRRFRSQEWVPPSAMVPHPAVRRVRRGPGAYADPGMFAPVPIPASAWPFAQPGPPPISGPLPAIPADPLAPPDRAAQPYQAAPAYPADAGCFPDPGYPPGRASAPSPVYSPPLAHMPPPYAPAALVPPAQACPPNPVPAPASAWESFPANEPPRTCKPCG